MGHWVSEEIGCGAYRIRGFLHHLQSKPWDDPQREHSEIKTGPFWRKPWWTTPSGQQRGWFDWGRGSMWRKVRPGPSGWQETHGLGKESVGGKTGGGSKPLHVLDQKRDGSGTAVRMTEKGETEQKVLSWTQMLTNFTGVAATEMEQRQETGTICWKVNRQDLGMKFPTGT